MRKTHGTIGRYGQGRGAADHRSKPAYRRSHWARPGAFKDLVQQVQDFEERLARRSLSWEPASLLHIGVWIASPAIMVLLIGLVVPHY